MSAPRIITVQARNDKRGVYQIAWPAWPTDVAGLVITSCVETGSGGFYPATDFTITHEPTGLTVSAVAFGSFAEMSELARLFAPLADWTARPDANVGAAVAETVASFFDGKPSTVGT